jgi:hypothetical protein
LTTYTLFMVGTAVLLDHSSALTSPLIIRSSDSGQSRRAPYFASRLANVLVYTTAMTTAVVILPIFALFCATACSSGWPACCLLRLFDQRDARDSDFVHGHDALVGADTLKRALSYVQLVMSFLVYGGYIFVSQFVSKIVTSSFVLPKSVWLLLYPGTWFASYLDIAAGKTSALELVPAGASVVAMVAMASGLSGRLSLEYSERLGAISASSQRAPARRRRSVPVSGSAPAKGGRWRCSSAPSFATTSGSG